MGGTHPESSGAVQSLGHNGAAGEGMRTQEEQRITQEAGEVTQQAPPPTTAKRVSFLLDYLRIRGNV